MATTQLRFGEWLVSQHVISEEQLEQAIQYKKKSGEKIGQTFISLKFISENQFLDFFAKFLNIPLYDLKLYNLDLAVSQQLPESFARLYRAILLKKQDNGVLIGMSDPMDVSAVDKLRDYLRTPISLSLVKEQDLERVFNLIYRHDKAISSFAHTLSAEMNKDTGMTVTAEKEIDAPVIDLLNTIFRDAAQMNASDVHIEPSETMIRIRLRIDGILHEQIVKEPTIMTAIASRLKLMAGLNISEKRFPQEGRFEIEPLGKKYEVRLSTMPTPFGESVVLRFLPQSQRLLQLTDIGMSGYVLERMRELFKKPNGIILVTGPTSSGKSTTLYAALNEINRPEIKIITIEDPIEYYLPWAIQIQTNEKIGLTFTVILRSILRHDPDVVLLGEMRDAETSSIAIRTALTGHLVLSTLHTNDTASAVYRLVDLGVEPYLIAATVQAILAQRLMRLICENCKEDYALNEQEKAWISKLKFVHETVSFKKGRGCSLCADTGYHGRTIIVELLEFDEAMSEALRNNDQNTFHKLAAKSLENKKLINDAYQLVAKGDSTVAEMMRVINEGFAM